MLIPGYESAELVSAARWAAAPEFWPATLCALAGSTLAADAFDAERVDVGVLLDQLTDHDNWPVYELPLANGDWLWVVMRNFADDEGIDYVYGGRTGTVIAALEGCFVGPGLSWSEAESIAAQRDPVYSAAERLLLVAPAVGDADLPPDATDAIAGALELVGATDAEQIAVEVLSTSRYWAADPWVEQNGARVCVGSHATRALGRLPIEDLRRMTEAFRG